jgi:hypothetical protein
MKSKFIFAALIFPFAGLSSAFAQAVQAPGQTQPIYIKCGGTGSLAVNAASGTVTMGGNTIPATITPSAIDFHYSAPGTGVTSIIWDNNYHIDRVTGMLNLSQTLHLPDGRSDGPHDSTFQCSPDAPPQTRF